jgi:hypothetical protein
MNRSVGENCFKYRGMRYLPMRSIPSKLKRFSNVHPMTSGSPLGI